MFETRWLGSLERDLKQWRLTLNLHKKSDDADGKC